MATSAATTSLTSRVATIDASGQTTGVRYGTATIRATAAADPSIGNTATLTVQRPVVYGIDATQGVVRYENSGGAPTVNPLTAKPGATVPPFSDGDFKKGLDFGRAP